MTAELDTPDDVIGKPIATVACCFKTLISDELAHGLKAIETQCRAVVKRMLAARSQTSSKFYKEVPCVIAKSLSAKYQRNPKCKSVKRLVIPICGDKGRQIKLVPGGVRIPALFKKTVLPVFWPRPGHVRGVEIHIHKPDGKLFSCPACGHEDHRDSNAAFNIGKRGFDCIGGLATHTARSRSGLIDSPASGTLVATNIQCN